MALYKTYLQSAAQRLKGRKRIPKFNPPRPPKHLERQYLREMLPYLEAINSAVTSIFLPRLQGLITQVDMMRPSAAKRVDAIDDEVVRLTGDVLMQVQSSYTDQEIEMIARRQGVSVSSFNKRIIEENIKKVVGIDVLFFEPYLADSLGLFATQNANLIKDILPDSMTKIERITMQGLQAGTRYKEMAQEILNVVNPRDGINRTRAEFIARDQTNKLNGQLNFLRQSELGVRKYIWRTVGDDRTRDSHAAHNGQEFRWDSPPADTGHPGEDYNCRCWAEPVFTDLIEGTEE